MGEFLNTTLSTKHSHRRITQNFFSFILLTFSFCASASDSTLNVYEAKKYSIEKYVSILEDKKNDLKIDDVSSSKFSSKFKENHKKTINFGISNSIYWLKFKIKYESPTSKKSDISKEFYIEVARSQFEIAEIYFVDQHGKISSKTSDRRTPYTQREIKYIYSVLPIILKNGETNQIYLRIKNRNSFYAPIILWPPELFAGKILHETFVYGVFYGCMIIIILYNILLYLSIRDLSYLYYVAFLCSSTAFEFIELGHSAIFFENNQILFQVESTPDWIWASWVFALLFTRNFLDIKSRHPFINQVIKVLIILSPIYIYLGHHVKYETALWSTVVFSLILLFLIPCLGIYCWHTGNRNAALFTLAWIFNMAGFAIYATVVLGITPANLFTLSAMPLGTALEAALLSFVLAERIKRIRKTILNSRKRAVESLSRYRSVFDNASAGMYKMSINGKLKDTNLSMAKMMGYPSIDQLRKSRINVGKILFSDKTKNYSMLLTNGKHQEEVSYLRMDGEQILAINSASIAYDLKGKPTHIEGTLIDITETNRKEIAQRERIMERWRMQLAKNESEEKTYFLKKISFEIRSTLNSIMGYSESLLFIKNNPSEKIELSQAVYNNSKSLLQLINDILDYSKIEAGKMTIESVPVDLAHLTESVRLSIKKAASQKGVIFDFLYRFPLPKEIYTDSVRIKQIILNMCIGIIESIEDGCIELNVLHDRKSEIMQYSIKIYNTGAIKEKIDFLFQALDEDVSFNLISNMGIYLRISIVKKLIKLMHGRISVEFVKTDEYLLNIYVSCKMAGRMEFVSNINTVADSTKKIETNDAGKLMGHVLLAEDNVVNQQLIQRIIRKTGAHVTIADDGEKALSLGKQLTFDLILMDVNMPHMDGICATKELRKAGYSKPIYALTAEHDQEQIDACLDAGCNGHLRKPIEMDKFLGVLNMALKRSP